MDIIKIKILTENKKIKTDIALLVDKIDFLRNLHRLREKWNITKLFNPNVGLDNLYYHIATKGDTLTNVNEEEKRISEFRNDIKELRKKNQRTSNFDVVIVYSLGYGVVPKHVFRSCYWDKILLPFKNSHNANFYTNSLLPEESDQGVPEEYQYVIVVDPRAEKKEIVRVCDSLLLHLKNKISFHGKDWVYNEGTKDDIEEFAFGPIYESAYTGKIKTQKKIDRTREWYWMRFGDFFNGKASKPRTYKMILDDWDKLCPQGEEHENEEEKKKCPYCGVDSFNVIERAVTEYLNLLRSQ